MTTTAQNLTIWSGDYKTITVTINDEDGVAQDITDFTATYVIANHVGDTAIITKEVGDGIVLTTPGSGILTITIDAEDTATLSGIMYHELEITDTSSKAATAFVGALTIKAESA